MYSRDEYLHAPHLTMDNDFGADLPGNKKPEKLLAGYDSDSDQALPDDSDVESVSEKSADDMFASDDEKPADGFDNAKFEKEVGIEDYKAQGTSDSKQDDVQIAAFNLRDEVELGLVDKDMNFVHGSESEAEDWMLASKLEIDTASAAQKKHASKSATVDTRLVGEILQSLISMLEPAETPMEALARLLPKKSKRQKQVRTKEQSKIAFALTGDCESLISLKGLLLVYEMSREELMRVYEAKTGNSFPRGTKRRASEPDNVYGPPEWEFRWVGEDAVNGPYSAYEMKYWVDTYFENNVEVRRCNTSDFKHVSGVTFD